MASIAELKPGEITTLDIALAALQDTDEAPAIKRYAEQLRMKLNGAVRVRVWRGE